MSAGDGCVIPATTVQCKTMADGTLRLSMDVEPLQARAAFDLFGLPGQAVAIAAIRPMPIAPAAPGRERSESQCANWAALGEKTKAAISIGGSPDFWAFTGTKNATQAAGYIKEYCGVESRKELEAPGPAQEKFKLLLRSYRSYTARKYEHESTGD